MKAHRLEPGATSIAKEGLAKLLAHGCGVQPGPAAAEQENGAPCMCMPGTRKAG